MSSIDLSSYAGINRRYESMLELLRENQKLQQLLFLGPVVTLLLCLLIIPVMYMVYVSFTTTFPEITFNLTLSNYADIVNTEGYVSTTIRTTILTGQTLIGVVFFGYVLAYGVARFGKHKKTLLVLIVLPFWINYLVRNYALIGLFQGQGPVNTMAQLLGLGTFEILYTRLAVLLGLVYSFLPVALLPMYASIARMDEALIHASKDLGAGPVKTFLNVTLPQTKDGIIVGSLLVAIPTFGAFITPVMLGGPSDGMIGTLINQQINSVYNIPLGAALGTMATVFVLSVLGVLGVINGGVPLLNNE